MTKCQIYIQRLQLLQFLAPTEVNLRAAAPASESKEKRLKAAVEDELDEEDEDEEDDPPSSERVRRAGGIGSRGFG